MGCGRVFRATRATPVSAVRPPEAKRPHYPTRECRAQRLRRRRPQSLWDKKATASATASASTAAQQTSAPLINLPPAPIVTAASSSRRPAASSQGQPTAPDGGTPAAAAAANDSELSSSSRVCNARALVGRSVTPAEAHICCTTRIASAASNCSAVSLSGFRSVENAIAGAVATVDCRLCAGDFPTATAHARRQPTGHTLAAAASVSERDGQSSIRLFSFSDWCATSWPATADAAERSRYRTVAQLLGDQKALTPLFSDDFSSRLRQTRILIFFSSCLSNVLLDHLCSNLCSEFIYLSYIPHTQSA